MNYEILLKMPSNFFYFLYLKSWSSFCMKLMPIRGFKWKYQKIPNFYEILLLYFVHVQNQMGILCFK